MSTFWFWLWVWLWLKPSQAKPSTLAFLHLHWLAKTYHISGGLLYLAFATTGLSETTCGGGTASIGSLSLQLFVTLLPIKQERFASLQALVTLTLVPNRSFETLTFIID